jgi:predicted metal-binding transcription factor (methanogenesis marker protein 9)
MQSIQTALESKLARLEGEIMTIDQMSQTVVSRRPVSKVPGKPDERYMVHTYSTNPESYGSLFWGCYDLSPAQAMDELMQKINREIERYRPDSNEDFQPLGDDIVTFKPCDLFATPDTLQDVHDYINKFSGGELTAATISSYMMYNWCAKISNPATREQI